MDDYLRNYFVALPVLVPIDFLWFGVLMKGLYLKELASLARMRDGKFAPQPLPGLLAWAVIPAGIVFFAVPHLTPGSSVLCWASSCTACTT